VDDHLRLQQPRAANQRDGGDHLLDDAHDGLHLRRGRPGASVVTKPEGNRDKTVYDERGMVYQAIRGYLSTEGSTEEYAYDGNGNRTARKDGRGKTWTTTFDLFDRATKNTTPLGHYTSFVLDENGNQTETKSYSSSDMPSLRTRSSTYDENEPAVEARAMARPGGADAG
jgi:YD repeat-containing protein